MMLTKDDRTRLEQIVGKQGVLCQVILVSMVPLLTALAAFKVYMAGLWADAAHCSMHTLFQLWAGGVSANSRYPGAIVNAADDLTLAMMYLGLAIMFTVAWWGGRKHRELTQRIVNTLKAGGAW